MSEQAVLILGGTTTVARALATYLLAGDTKLASAHHITNKLIKADRYSVKPATTYLDKEFLRLLDDPDSLLEYKQINLGNVARHAEVFRPPKEWKGKTGWDKFDVVFDLTGEIGFDKPELIHISQTYQLALALANSASTLPQELRPKAYVRLTHPFYEMKSSSSGHAEGEKLKPDGVRGRWWHETLRGLGKLDLNVGIVRCGAWYGRGTWEGEVIPRLVVGQVYKYLEEEMKFLYKYGSDLRIDTVHTSDIAQALHLLGRYLVTHDRTTIMSQSAVEIPATWTTGFSLSSKRASMSEAWKNIETVIPEKEKVFLPIFNVVDENFSTQEKLAKAVAEVWDVNFGFLNNTITSLVAQFAKTDFVEMVEDVNEIHVQGWSKLLAASSIDSTPISPFLDEHAFRKHAICLDGTKACKILGYKAARPKVDVDELRFIIRGFQEDNIW